MSVSQLKLQKRDLSKTDSAAISKVLALHGLEILDGRREEFLRSIVSAMTLGDLLREFEEDQAGRIQTERQIEDLRHALAGLSRSAFGLIQDAMTRTDGYRVLKEHGFPECGIKITDDDHVLPSLFRALVGDILEAACIEVLTAGDEVLGSHFRKRGRPSKQSNVIMVQRLIACFELATGAHAGETTDGPFDSFLHTVFLIADPTFTGRHSFQKLIRAAKGKR